MSPYFPPIEPHTTGTLETPDGHRVYWERSGSPSGRPALYLHGGPGIAASPGARRFFDPARFDVVIVHQRGCGRSRPLASDPDADLSTHTTHHLVRDLELLREHLGIARWTILGLSWGTTLALAYAQQHPERVAALVLGLVTTTSRREVRWITEDVGCLFPREHARFREAVPTHLRELPLVDAYARLLSDPDPAIRDAAALEWCAWEDAHVSLSPGHRSSPLWGDPIVRLGFARLVTHTWRHAAFLEDEQLIRDAPRLDGIPGALIHGRYDVSSPLETAWRLSQRWRTSQLEVLAQTGHGYGDELPTAVIAALHRLGAKDG